MSSDEKNVTYEQLCEATSFVVRRSKSFRSGSPIAQRHHTEAVHAVEILSGDIRTWGASAWGRFEPTEPSSHETARLMSHRYTQLCTACSLFGLLVSLCDTVD